MRKFILSVFSVLCVFCAFEAEVFAQSEKDDGSVFSSLTFDPKAAYIVRNTAGVTAIGVNSLVHKSSGLVLGLEIDHVRDQKGLIYEASFTLPLD